MALNMLSNRMISHPNRKEFSTKQSEGCDFMHYLLDTNIVSAFINNVGDINSRLYQISGDGKEAFISIITHYEIRRGLLAVNAVRKMKIFERFCRRFRILFLDTVEISEKAAEIHTDLKKQGLSDS